MANLIAQLMLRLPTVAGIFLVAAGIFCNTVGWGWYIVFGRGLAVPVPFFGLLLLLAGAFALVVKGRDAPLPLFLFKGHDEDDHHDAAPLLTRVTTAGCRRN